LVVIPCWWSGDQPRYYFSSFLLYYFFPFFSFLFLLFFFVFCHLFAKLTFTASLATTIHFQRPDLLSVQHIDPISLNPPHDYFTSILFLFKAFITICSFYYGKISVFGQSVSLCMHRFLLISNSFLKLAGT
jgi:hypothetical protein